jgi:hypothetical protein
MRKMWPSGDLSAGGTGEIKRVSIGDVAITVCQFPAGFPSEYVTSSPARKEGRLYHAAGMAKPYLPVENWSARVVKSADIYIYRYGSI